MSRVALVTGGRRGIGRAVAEALAGTGLEVVITSRATVVDPTDGITALPLDLADRASIDKLVDDIDARWGGVDVLVNNALCEQPGSQAPLGEMDFAAFETMVVGEVVNTAYLTCRILSLGSRRPVTVVDIGSAAAEHTPARPVGQGGWAWSYSATKAALHRLAPFLHLEYGPERVRAFTVDPGFVRTEALLEHLGDVPGSSPPEMPARVVQWLVEDPGSDRLLGRYLHARDLAAELGWSF